MSGRAPTFPSAPAFTASSGYQLPHGQGDALAVLDGRPGDQVTCKGEGPAYFEWSVKQRVALDLELRARIVATTAPLATTPIIRWKLELGHGDQTWNLPAGPLPIISGTFHESPILPGRGLLLRLSARRLKITFSGGLDLDGDEVVNTTIAVSVQPSTGDRCCNVDAYTQWADPSATPPPPHLQPFPMGARQFRLREPDTGLPFQIGDCAVLFSAIAGELFGPVDATAYTQWSSIPVHAVALLTDAVAQVEYR